MKAWRLLILSLFLSTAGWCQKSKLDSLKDVLASTAPEKKIDILQSIIIKLWLNQPDSAMIFAKQAVDISQGLDIRSKAIAVRLLGGVYYYKGQYDSTIKYSYKALKYLETTRDSTLLTSSMNNLGLAFYSVGSYPEALEYLLRALNLKYKIKQQYGLTQTLNNVGLVYSELKQYDKAKEYFDRAIRLSNELKDDDGLLYSYNNMGFTFMKEKKIDEGEKYFKLSEVISDQIDNAVWESATFSGLGDVALQRKDYKKARQYFDRSLQMSRNINEPGGIAEIYSYFSQMHAKTGNTDSAFYYLDESQKIAKQIRAKDLELSNYKAYSELCAQLKQYDKAFDYQKKFIALSDTLLEQNLSRNINDIQLQIQNEETKDQLKAKDKEISSRTNTAYFLAAILALSILSAAGAYFSLKRERKLKNDLARKNYEIENQKEELLNSNEQLEQAHRLIIKQNQELEDFNQRLQLTVETRTQQLEKANTELGLVNLELDNFIYKSSHDIKGPLVRLIGLCHVALMDVKDETAREYLVRLDESARNLSDLFDRLKIVSDINSIELKREKIGFEKIMQTVKGRLRKLEGFERIIFKESIQETNFESDSYLIETIFTNMIENAIKFQKKSVEHDKVIEVDVRQEKDKLHVSFIDNGIGIRETDHKHLFQMFSNAALEHKNVGLGLYIVKQCVAKLHGSIQLVSNKNQYTEFEVTLPLN